MTDTARDTFQDWLDGFKRDVDAVIAGAAAPSGAAAAGAKQAFDNWWDAKQDPLLAAPKTDLDAQRLEALAKENADMRLEYKKTFADAAARNETLAMHNAQLDGQVQELRQRVDALEKDKLFLEENARKACAEKDSALQDLALERERGMLSAREVVSLKHKVDALETALETIRRELASRDGRLEELHRQAGTYQERLVHSKELTDADVALLRQELKLFVEEFRVITNSLRKG